MSKIKLLNTKGESSKDITLNEKIWGIEPNEQALKKAIRLQLNATRQGTKATKTVGEVAGSNKKPWRQKGTGRARVGQKRNPIWRGGGHAFALSPRDYSFKINKKERVLALKSALSTKAKEKQLIVLETLELPTLKTKELKELMKNLKLEGKVLFVTYEDNPNLWMAARNLEKALVLMADEINVYDVINADTLICDEETIKHIEEVLN